MHNPMYSVIDQYYYQEAGQHLASIREFFETEFGPDHVLTAETYLAYALVCLKLGQFGTCMDELQRALMIFQNQLGEFEFKTKEVANLLRSLDQLGNQQQ